MVKVKRKLFHISADTHKKLLEMANKRNEPTEITLTKALMKDQISLECAEKIKYYSMKTGLKIQDVCCMNEPEFAITFHLGVEDESTWLVCGVCSKKDIFSTRVKDVKDVSYLS